LEEIVLIAYFENKIIVHASFGNKVNETLSKLILSKLHYLAKSKVDAYRIIFVLEGLVSEKHANEIKEIIEKYDGNLEDDIDSFVCQSDLFYLRFTNVAKRFGIIKNDAEISKMIIRGLAREFFGSVVWQEALKELKVEKLDLEKLKEVLGMIKEGKIKVFVVKGASPLAKLGLKKVFIEFYEEKSKDVLELFKKRVLEARVKLICLNCGVWRKVYTLAEMPEDVACEHCGARLLTVVKSTNLKAERIVEKYVNKKKMNKTEEDEFKKLLARATLFMTYGRKAAIAFSVRGVGVENAKRILNRYFKDENEFFEALFDAEKTFIRNRRFWKI
jgi:ATP-dependent Lhr-like helicase